MSKIIQVPIDDPLLDELDKASMEQRISRSALVRAACRDFLRRLRERKLDDLYEQGYRRIPEGAEAGEWQARATAEVLPKETW